MTKEQLDFMREAIRLSRYGMDQNHGGPFGSVIVRDGEIVGRGNNMVTSTNDPTAHAEITAIRDACRRLNTYDLTGCDIYASCEPCPMCLTAIYWARIRNIYFACTRKDAAHIGFDDEMLYKEIPKEHAMRVIPIEQCLRDEAYLVFEDWLVKPDKVMF